MPRTVKHTVQGKNCPGGIRGQERVGDNLLKMGLIPYAAHLKAMVRKLMVG